ncbi:MAG: hypothetical protein HYW25_05485 [Candidatus Aenigmarchaeota archaeon]|nr:hypothetical protein [Candidatus Aenigmarchaeota archaeon]
MSGYLQLLLGESALVGAGYLVIDFIMAGAMRDWEPSFDRDMPQYSVGERARRLESACGRPTGPFTCRALRYLRGRYISMPEPEITEVSSAEPVPFAATAAP